MGEHCNREGTNELTKGKTKSKPGDGGSGVSERPVRRATEKPSNPNNDDRTPSHGRSAKWGGGEQRKKEKRGQKKKDKTKPRSKTGQSS